MIQIKKCNQIIQSTLIKLSTTDKTANRPKQIRNMYANEVAYTTCVFYGDATNRRP